MEQETEKFFQSFCYTIILKVLKTRGKIVLVLNNEIGSFWFQKCSSSWEIQLSLQCWWFQWPIHEKFGFGESYRACILASAHQVSLHLPSGRGIFSFWRSNLHSQVGLLAPWWIFGKPTDLPLLLNNNL